MEKIINKAIREWKKEHDEPPTIIFINPDDAQEHFPWADSYRGLVFIHHLGVEKGTIRIDGD